MDAELVAHIRQQILASRFHGEGYRKIWGRLRFAGVRTSPRRERRLIGAHDLLAPHRVGRLRSRTHDSTIVTETVNVMWGTDMTETITVAEGGARVFIAVDHANSEVVGIYASKSGNRFESLEPVRQGVRRHFGSIGPGIAVRLKLGHDHGSNYMSGDFQAEIKCLAIISSPSFVREPEGNGVAERFIRTLKENFLWVHTFDTVEDLRRALVEFARHYNKPGSSPGMDTASQPRCAPTNSGLIRRPCPSYPWPPE
ncbi:integrase core domain-containing protein [Azospirillum sp. A26]